MTDWDIVELPSFEPEFDKLVSRSRKTNTDALSQDEISQIMEELIRRYRETGSFASVNRVILDDGSDS